MASEQVIYGGRIYFAILEQTPAGPNALISDSYYIDVDTRVISIEEAIERINQIEGIRCEKEIT